MVYVDSGPHLCRPTRGLHSIYGVAVLIAPATNQKRRKMGNKPIPRVCSSCVYLVTQEGEPYYCTIKDLYTFRKPSDKACWEFTLPKEKE